MNITFKKIEFFKESKLLNEKLVKLNIKLFHLNELITEYKKKSRQSLYIYFLIE